MPVSAPTQVGTVNFTYFGGGGTPTFTVGAGGIPSGAFIDIVISIDTNGITVSSVTDAHSSWTVQANGSGSSDVSGQSNTFYLSTVAGGAYTNGNTIAVNLSSSANINGVGRCNYWTGNAASTPIDQASSNTTTSFTNTYASASVTTLQAAEALVGWLAIGSSTPTPSGTIATSDFNATNANSGKTLYTHYAIVAATGSYAEQGSLSVNDHPVAGIVTFKAAAVVPGAPGGNKAGLLMVL